MSGQVEMPKYKSHKEVWALKIHAIEGDGIIGGFRITPANTGYAPFIVEDAYVIKHNPQVGGYYVVYADGYKSFSPAEAFESGYTLATRDAAPTDAISDEQLIEMASDYLGIDYDRVPYGVVNLCRTVIAAIAPREKT